MTLKVITGDHKLTTIAIVNDLGIHVSEKHALEWNDLDILSDEELKKIIKDIVIFARVEPRHKIRIVTAYNPMEI
jgi:P-type Ca2+ transporter type 2C